MSETNIPTFKDLGLSEDILNAIEKKGYKNPSSIQAGVIPLLLNGNKDVIGKAQTGTGKTAAFGLPLLDRLDSSMSHVQALILCPTRELAIQVGEEIKSFTRSGGVKLTLLYGGQPIREEMKELRNKPQIVVGTPGRVIDHLNKGRLKVDNLSYFILDEADEMLNVGFRDEIEDIFELTPKDKRVLLFSATMPRAIMGIVKSYMKDYELVEVKSDNLTNDNISQNYYIVNRHDKFDALCRIIEMDDDFYSIVFCKTKIDVDEVASKLMGKGYLAEGIHGDIEQKMREKILSRFKSKKINVLVATDVAARGIDVNNITHVINYSMPENPEIYTHRIGRTGRAGNKGEAITFIAKSEIGRICFFEKVIKSKITKGTIPSIKEVIDKKQKHLVDSVSNMIESGDSKYSEIATELLSNNEPEAVVKALLTKFYNKDLDVDNYTDIKDEMSSYTDNNKFSRLFLAKGKNDGINSPGDVLSLIGSETGLEMENIGKISIFDQFSFFEAPNSEAEIILQIFKSLNKTRPLVVKAKSKTSDSGSRGGGYRGRSGGRQDRRQGGQSNGRRRFSGRSRDSRG